MSFCESGLELAVAGAGVVATSVTRRVAAGAGFGAEILAIPRDMMVGGDFAFTIRTGTRGFGSSVHRLDI